MARITSSPILEPRYFTRTAAGDRDIHGFFREYGADQYHLYSYGRTALLDGVGLLDSQEGDEVLVPACSCNSAVDPLTKAGLSTRFYRVTRELEPDLEDLKRRVNSDVAAVVVIDYFGFPSRGFQEVRELCDDHGIPLISDSAHTALTLCETDEGAKVAGARGDLGITCIWKPYPIPDGATLFVNDEELRERTDRLTRSGVRDGATFDDYRYMLVSSLLRSFEHRHSPRFVHRTYKKVVGYNGPPGNGKMVIPEHRMSRFAARMIEKIDPMDVIEGRRTSYEAWLDVVDEVSGVEPVFDALPDGVCPLDFAVRTDDAERLMEAVEDVGIYGAHLWPPLPGRLKDDPEYPNSNYLSEHQVCLPTHQGIRPDDLKARVRRLAEEF